MALIKKKMTDFGIEADYWKITMISIDRDKKLASFSLSLYKDKSAKSFIETHTVSSLMEAEDSTKFEKYLESNSYKDIYNACYMYAKENEAYFSDAQDDADEIALNKK